MLYLARLGRGNGALKQALEPSFGAKETDKSGRLGPELASRSYRFWRPMIFCCSIELRRGPGHAKRISSVLLGVVLLTSAGLLCPTRAQAQSANTLYKRAEAA